MSKIIEKDASNQSEKDGRGRRVPEKVRNLIKDTFIGLIQEGKTGRETSAQVIDQRIRQNSPQLADLLPSLQSINKIVEPYRRNLGEKNVLEQEWSLSLWMKDSYGIVRSDLPLILRLQKFMALDVDHRISIGLKEHRLSIREAKWVGPIRDIMVGLTESSNKSQGKLIDETQGYFLRNLLSHVEGYARREQALEILERQADTYDLDLELAWSDMEVPFSGKSFTQQTLYKEMRLIPDSSIMRRGQEIMNLEGSLATGSDTDLENYEYGDRRLSPENEKIRQALLLFIRNGIEVKLQFGTEDWRSQKSRENWGQIPWIPNPEDLFSTSVEYVIDHELLEPVWSFIKFEAEVTESDSHQVKVATAFWAKIKGRIVEMIKDPKVQERLKKL